MILKIAVWSDSLQICALQQYVDLLILLLEYNTDFYSDH